MDLHSYLHHTEDEILQQEDDILYDELRRQVMQLTAEDDDDDGEIDAYRSKILKARNLGPCTAPRARCYYNWPGKNQDCAVAAPVWMTNLWRTGNHGTGVFIPQTVQSRRRNRSRQKNERAYKRVERMN